MTQISVSAARSRARLEKRIGEDLEVFLRRRYLDEQKTQAEIAGELRVETSTVSRWMARFSIETRLFASDAEPLREATA